MQKKPLDWSKLGFAYRPTDFRYQANWKDGSWDEGGLVTDPNIVLSEAACVFHYAQSCFEGLKAYTTKDGRIVTFRPDMNAERMANTRAAWKCPHSRKTSSCKPSWIPYEPTPHGYLLSARVPHCIFARS